MAVALEQVRNRIKNKISTLSRQKNFIFLNCRCRKLQLPLPIASQNQSSKTGENLWTSTGFKNVPCICWPTLSDNLFNSFIELFVCSSNLLLMLRIPFRRACHAINFDYQVLMYKSLSTSQLVIMTIWRKIFYKNIKCTCLTI